MTDLLNPIFHNEEAARAHFEATRWPNGPYCPLCGSIEAKPYGGKSMGPGWYWCGSCRRKFTATMGTVCERSHIPLKKWLLAMHLMCSSKKGMSAHQLHRMLRVTYKSAWFMAMRIREAMRELDPIASGPMGGEGKIAEAEETFVGGKETNKHKKVRTKQQTGGFQGKEPVFSIVERGGKVRSNHVPHVNAPTLRPILEAHLDKNSILMTDGEGQYRILGLMYARHEAVNHRIGEYACGEAHTNTVEKAISRSSSAASWGHTIMLASST